MGANESTSKSQADVAHFYRTLGRAGADGMPMPFQVTFQTDGSMRLRYDTVEDVDAAVARVGGTAGHDSHTYEASHRTWHSYGTRYGGGQSAAWAGWTVEVWAAVDGPGVES